jgi:hypothetical protein
MADTIGQMPSLEMRPSNQDEPDSMLDQLEKDFERLKSQKARPTGGVEGQTLTNLCFLNDEPYVNYKNKTLSLESQDSNKLYLSFNLIAPRVYKLLGRLAAFNAPFKARPNRKDPQAIEEAEIVDRMLVALDEKVDEPSRMRERLYWLLVGGTAFEHVPWVPNATIEPQAQFAPNGELLYKWLGDPTGQSQPIPESAMQAAVAAGQAAPEEFEPYEEVETVGEIGSEVLGPFNVFVDASVRSISDLAPDQWVHIAQIKTVGWIKENYQIDVEAQKDLSLVSSKINVQTGDAVGTYLKDLIPLVQGSTDENDPEMVLHVQSYQPASTEHPRGRYVCWIPNQQILHDAENPYEEIPLVDFHFTPVTTSFWSKAFITPLISPQRFINKRMSQLGEQSNATIYSNLLLGPGINESDIPADKPGVIRNGLLENGAPGVQRVPPPEIPAWFLQSIEMATKMFNDSAGGADLMEDNKFPGQLRGPLAVPMLQEILDTQWGPLFQHLGERLSRVKQMRLNRVKQFYPPLRTMHYTDRDQRDEVITFHTEKILRSGTNFSVTVERGSILPELRALRESRLMERLRSPLAVLYMDERTGKLDKSKIAADLQFGDTGREGRESKYRKLAQEIIKMLWSGREVPPVQPFYDHKSMLDELEDAMSTTEFLKASPKIQQLFGDRWSQHEAFLQKEAQAQQMSMQSGMIQNAVAQATQQAAAMAASDAVHSATQQVHAQQGQPTGQYVASADAQAQQKWGGGSAGAPKRPANQAPAGATNGHSTSSLVRKTTIEEHKA